MKIAQIAPLYESVPPKLYGGTERIVSYLTEALVDDGHEVTLFASGDSQTTATLVPGSPRALRLDTDCVDPLAHHIAMLNQVFSRMDDFDILHFHLDYLHFPLSTLLHAPTLTTLHGRLDIPDLVPLYREFSQMPVVSISLAQRMPLPYLNWQGTVAHGLPEYQYRGVQRPGNYLAFLGRISPEKGLENAIEISVRSNIPLKISAKVDRVDRIYFEEKIEPLLHRHADLVEYIGEIGDADKQEFLGNALALLFPICWPEPFGLVMIEAMACGVPIIAFRRGSVPEVMTDGVTGFVVDNVSEAVRALGKIDQISRRECRENFERRFTAARMAQHYLSHYRDIVARRQIGRRAYAEELASGSFSESRLLHSMSGSSLPHEKRSCERRH